MKKISLILIIIILSCNPVYSKNFNEDIESYYSKNSGTVASIYGLNRCAAVLVYISSKLFNEPGQKDNALKYVTLSTVASEYATKLHSKNSNVSYNKALISMEKRMMQLDKLYRDDAKQNFLKEGKYISSIILSDIDYCTQVVVGLINSEK